MKKSKTIIEKAEELVPRFSTQEQVSSGEWEKPEYLYKLRKMFGSHGIASQGQFIRTRRGANFRLSPLPQTATQNPINTDLTIIFLYLLANIYTLRLRSG